MNNFDILGGVKALHPLKFFAQFRDQKKWAKSGQAQFLSEKLLRKSYKTVTKSAKSPEKVGTSPAFAHF